MQKLFVLSFIASTFFVLAGFDGCGGTEGEGEGEGSAGEGEGEGEGSVGEGEGEGEGEGAGATRTFQCQDPNAPVVSQTSCADDSECAVGSILADCCGSTILTGINAFSVCGFQGAAGACFTAVCDCVAQQTVADDGSHAATVDQTPVVACVNHVCTTSFGP